MVRDFVLAFGGTGARCLEALTYLQAAGCGPAPLHILLIDPDTANGNVATTRDQLQRFHTIQDTLDPSPGISSSHFATRVNPDQPPTSFFWEYPSDQLESFRSILEYARLDPRDRDLVDLLYDRRDLDMSFEKGYVGRAHVGSLDLLRTLQQSVESDAKGQTHNALHWFFRALRAAAQGEGARLVVMASNFGGTGASGLPSIPPLVEQVLPKVAEGVSLGCVQMAPYFSFPASRDATGGPDSALHTLATQAALYHYAYSDVGYDRHYLVGAPEQRQTSDEHVPGGTQQKNEAHYAELGAALAAVDFLRTPPSGSPAEVSACGQTELRWSVLPLSDETRLREGMVSLTTSCLAHRRFFHEDLREGRHRGFPWRRRLEADSNRRLGGREEELDAFKRFSTRYLDWAREVDKSAERRFFGPGITQERASSSALGETVPGGRKGGDPYHELMTFLNRVDNVDQSSGTGWYLQALSTAARAFCKAHYQDWWRDDG